MPAESVGYFEHIADMGIIGRGATIEKAFESAAQAMFGIMTSLDVVQAKTSFTVEFTEADVEFALVTWLNLLIANAKDHGIIPSRFHLQRNDSAWHGQAWGEAWRDDMVRGTEVKGATLTMLSVKRIDNMWEARCVLDV